jgi:hypothetical protein
MLPLISPFPFPLMTIPPPVPVGPTGRATAPRMMRLPASIAMFVRGPTPFAATLPVNVKLTGPDHSFVPLMLRMVPAVDNDSPATEMPP